MKYKAQSSMNTSVSSIVEGSPQPNKSANGTTLFDGTRPIDYNGDDTLEEGVDSSDDFKVEDDDIGPGFGKKVDVDSAEGDVEEHEDGLNSANQYISP